MINNNISLNIATKIVEIDYKKNKIVYSNAQNYNIIAIIDNTNWNVSNINTLNVAN
jgi:hypothetical protein